MAPRILDAMAGSLPRFRAVAFTSEAERAAEGLRRELEQEREVRRKLEEAKGRLDAELKGLRAEVERQRTELDRLRPRVRLPLGWFRMPVIAVLPLLVLALVILVGTVLSTARAERRAQQLEHERDVLAKAANRETAARRAVEREAGPAVMGCLSACGCPDGQGCVGEVCREGVSPAHCCDRTECPSGAPCQHWDGSESVCGQRGPRGP